MSDHLTVDSPLEYILYWVAHKYPVVMANAEHFSGRMLAEDQKAIQRAKNFIAFEGARSRGRMTTKENR